MNVKNKICLVVPVFNGASQIGELIERIERVSHLPLIIVNDGSADETEKIVCKYPHVHLINHSENKGKGIAISTGIRFAQSRGFTYAVFLDSDLQHPPENIPAFITKLEETNADMIIGCRDFTIGTMPFHRILSNTITSMILSIRTGFRIHDSQCGYRCIRLNNLKPEEFIYTGFQFESEFLIRVLKPGSRYAEIPIPTIYDTEGSSINNFMDTFRFIILYFRSYLWT